MVTLERAAKIREAQLGPTHPSLAVIHSNLGGVHVNRGESAAAVADYGRAIEIREAAFGPSHVELVHPLLGRGEALSKLQRYDASLADLERAASICEREKVPSTQRGYVELVLARTLWDAGGDRRRAHALAESAAARAVGPSEAEHELRNEAQQWLHEHPKPG
jgi:eukaryotic-like serine/threonine-protein kinase